MVNGENATLLVVLVAHVEEDGGGDGSLVGVGCRGDVSLLGLDKFCASEHLRLGRCLGLGGRAFGHSTEDIEHAHQQDENREDHAHTDACHSPCQTPIGR